MTKRSTICQRQYACEAAHLFKLLCAVDAPDHRLLALLTEAMNLEGDDVEPAAREAVEHFYRLSDAAQRKVLGGWRPEPARIRTSHVRLSDDDTPARRVLVIEAHADAMLASEHRFIPDESTAAVVLHVAEGTSCAEALAALQRCMTDLEQNWAVLIDQRPHSARD